MSQILTRKLLNDELNINDLLLWLKKSYKENAKCLEILECSQKDFVTYFLNTLHDTLARATNESPNKTKVRNTSSETSRISHNAINAPHCSSINSFNFTQNTLDMTCTSTPKHERLKDNSSFDNECSPISINSQSSIGNIPNSREINSHTRNGNNSSFRNGNSTNSSICLGDFIVSNKKNSSKKKSNKKAKNSLTETDRITVRKLKPTNLNESKFNSIQLKSENSFNFQNNAVEISSEKVNSNFMIRRIPSENKPLKTVPLKVTTELRTNKITITTKNIKNVKQIEKIVIIYEFLLKHGFVLSLVGELYFIINLLVSKSSCDNKVIEENISNDNVKFEDIFNSIDDITFFASTMLEKVSNLLKSLDKITLKYLSENERLKCFSPNLVDKLRKLAEEKIEYNLNLCTPNSQKTIYFVLETDNQSNFPTDGSFQGFKKQRDLFYEILRLWEKSHMQHQWDFDLALGKKVKILVGFHNDPVNFMRLSRLFMEQLLNTCSKKSTNSDVLSSLSNVDKDKIDRLKNRLMKKQTNGLNTTPDFCGYQEFFRDFIVSSNNPIFLRHLCNVFISEITELNATTFDILDAESNESETEFDTKKAYVSCLKSLKTLAKFLGYIESMPYQNKNNHSQEMMVYQIKIRNQVHPSFNVKKLLEDSLSGGTLTLLVPWLCEYLSMLDIVTLRTKYYIDVIEILMKLYRHIVQTDSLFPFYNSILIQFSLGWFFELSNFPHSIFFDKLLEDHTEIKSKLQKSIGFDRLSIVDDNILNILCPFLEEFRKLLANETAVKDRITSRHITPLSKVESLKETTKKKIEVQLEEAFFASHPSSLRKTVDFVAERIASTCVKHLCYSVVPEFKKEFCNLIQTNLKQWSNEEDFNFMDAGNKCTTLAEEKITELKALCDKEVNKIIQNRVKTSIEALLPIDYLQLMQNICVTSTERMSREKIQQWACTHIIISLLTKEVKLELKNFSDLSKNRMKPSYGLPPCGNGVDFDPNAPSAAHTLTNIRIIMASLLNVEEKVTNEELIQNLDDAYQTMTKRNDINEVAKKMICNQLVDLMLLLATHQPLTLIETKEFFIKVWKLTGDESEELFKNLINERNFNILSRSSLISESLDAIAFICVSLLKERLLSTDCFEFQCTSLFKNDLDENILKIVTSFFKSFIDIYKRQCNSSQFTFLLEFLADYCSDM